MNDESGVLTESVLRNAARALKTPSRGLDPVETVSPPVPPVPSCRPAPARETDDIATGV